jgi:hypothetical protein
MDWPFVHVLYNSGLEDLIACGKVDGGEVVVALFAVILSGM